MKFEYKKFDYFIYQKKKKREKAGLSAEYFTKHETKTHTKTSRIQLLQ